MDVIDKIKCLASEKGMKMKFITDSLGLNASYFSNVKSGKTQITRDRLETVANLLGTTVEYLTGDSDVAFANKSDKAQKKVDNHLASRVMVNNIGYIAGVLDLDNSELARVMGISKGAIYKRKSQPWTFRFGEIEKLADYAIRHGISVTAAQMMVPFGPGVVERYGEAEHG